MVLWLLLFLLLAALLWLLWAPFRLEIDSTRGIYRLAWAPLAAATWLPEKGLDVVEIRVLFFRRKIALATVGKRKPKLEKPPATKQKRRPKPSGRARFSLKNWSLVINLLKTFRVRHCRVWWDSDDFVLNAWLFPVGRLLTGGNIRLAVNFQGRRDLALLVENRLGRILWVITKFFVHHKQPRS